MRYKPERALTLIKTDDQDHSGYIVEMRYKPERALTPAIMITKIYEGHKGRNEV